MELNHVLVIQFIHGRTLRKTKTDKLDARSIAYHLITVDYKPYPPQLYHTFSMKSLTRFRDKLIRQRSDYMVRMTNVLDCVFPEFKLFFNNKFSVTALHILANYPSPDKIANMNSRSYDNLRRVSRGKFSMDKFVFLKRLARNTR
jgi:transposase